MQFHESPMGREFFQRQLPLLIRTLTDISKRLRQPAPVSLSHKADWDKFLTELYYGSYDPSDVPGTAGQTARTKEIIACQDKLCTEVSDEVWDMIENYRSLLEERHCEEREQAFAVGFRCAMTMLAAGLSVPAGNSTHE